MEKYNQKSHKTELSLFNILNFQPPLSKDRIWFGLTDESVSLVKL